MRDVCRAAFAESLKLKRTLALRLATIAPLLIVFIVFGAYLQRGGGGPNPLVGFAQLNLTLWTILVLPLYTALLAALLAGIEHQTDTGSIFSPCHSIAEPSSPPSGRRPLDSCW